MSTFARSAATDKKFLRKSAVHKATFWTTKTMLGWTLRRRTSRAIQASTWITTVQMDSWTSQVSCLIWRHRRTARQVAVDFRTTRSCSDSTGSVGSNTKPWRSGSVKLKNFSPRTSRIWTFSRSNTSSRSTPLQSWIKTDRPPWKLLKKTAHVIKWSLNSEKRE